MVICYGSPRWPRQIESCMCLLQWRGMISKWPHWSLSRETSCGRQNSLVVPRTLISWYPCLVSFLPIECVLDLWPVSKQKHTANVVGCPWLHVCDYITKNCNGFPARRLFLSCCLWKSKLPCSKPYGDCRMTRSRGLPTTYSWKEIEVLCLAPCKELNSANNCVKYCLSFPSGDSDKTAATANSLIETLGAPKPRTQVKHFWIPNTCVCVLSR